jgi:hypothetical protein
MQRKERLRQLPRIHFKCKGSEVCQRRLVFLDPEASLIRFAENELSGLLDERLPFGIFTGDAASIGWAIYEAVENPDSAVFAILGFLLGGSPSRKPLSDAA